MAKAITPQADFWLGTEASHEAAVASMDRMTAYMQEHGIKAAMEDDDDDEERTSPFMEKIDGTAVISIEGMLVDGEWGIFGKWFGITGYGDIQRAAIEAVNDTSIRSILLVVKSGGGSVAGVAETAELIANIDKVKPVVTYAASTMASAALWLGASARHVYGGKTSMVGSVGTIQVLVSRHRALKEGGVDAVVVRAGSKKALGHPAEPMSDEAVAEAQAQCDYLTNLFLSYIADRRGHSMAYAKSKYGEGQVFIGEQAVDAGLLDAVAGYTDAFSKAKMLGGPDNRPRFISAEAADNKISANNPAQEKGTSMPHIPTAEELAAMAAAGIDISAQAGQADADANAAGGDDPENPDADVKPEANAEVADLQASLNEALAQVAALTASLEDAQAKVVTAEASVAQYSGLADIARNAIRTMTVAMNGDSNAVAEIPVEMLAAKHTEISATFKEKFKAGGVAATKPESKEETPVAQVNPLFKAAALLKSRK